MTYETFLAIPLNIREALTTYYNLPEMEFYEVSRDQTKLEQILPPALLNEKEALHDGYLLTQALWLMFTADSFREYERDIKRYNEVAETINKIYGNIVELHQKDKKQLGFGFKGHLKSNIAIIITIHVIDGETLETTENVNQLLSEINEKYRSDI